MTKDIQATGEVLEAVVSALVKKETLPLVEEVRKLAKEIAALRERLEPRGAGDV
jgi:hypothetical protein